MTAVYVLNHKILEHNDNGPANITFFYKNKNIQIICFKQNGLFHRTNGPAYIFYKDDILIEEQYLINNRIHNVTGPAWRKFDLNLKKWRNDYFVNNEFISKEIFLNILENRLKTGGLHE
jgi:hypothetical protein